MTLEIEYGYDYTSGYQPLCSSVEDLLIAEEEGDILDYMTLPEGSVEQDKDINDAYASLANLLENR